MMKSLMPCLLLFTSASLFAQKTPAADTIIQNWHRDDRKEPTEREVLVKIQPLDLTGKKVSGLALWLFNEELNKVWHGVTDDYGEVIFLLPRARKFRIDVAEETGIESFATVNDRFVTSTLKIRYVAKEYTESERNDTVFQVVSPAQMPNRSRVLVILNVLDLDNRPLENERLYLVSSKTAKVFFAQTNAAGKALLMLPKGSRYCLSTDCDADIECFDLPQTDHAGKLILTYNFIGSKAILARRAERARQLAIRDSLYRLQRIRDSIQFARDSVRNLLDHGFLNNIQFGADLKKVEERIEKRAEQERVYIAENPNFFEEMGEEIKSTFYRKRHEWANKVIVTDLTCSMEPYLDQVLLWHALRLTGDERKTYLFFNDGDGKSQEQKIIGQTGGFHISDAVDMQELMKKMLETTRYGCSGDTPENDLEAVLEGVKLLQGMDELILIADNYSDVRDIELLTQLDVPIHIVLCGTEFGVNEQYLEIAWKTAGSIHTIEQDIEDLTKLADGETITIGAYQYRVSKGKFIQVSKI